MLSLATAACGGGGSDSAMAGTVRTQGFQSSHTGSAYPIHVYLPPGNAAAHAAMPVVYLLDGDSRLDTMVQIVESTRTLVIVVAIGNEARRNQDYVPVNTCTSGGGGHVAYLNFIRLELTPFIEANFGGRPLRRVLLAHSHAGSFVVHALFAEAGANRHFSAYLASDASIPCMRETLDGLDGWEAAYAATNTSLPPAPAPGVCRQCGQRRLGDAPAGPPLRRADPGSQCLRQWAHRHDPHRLCRCARVCFGLVALA